MVHWGPVVRKGADLDGGRNSSAHCFEETRCSRLTKNALGGRGRELPPGIT